MPTTLNSTTLAVGSIIKIMQGGQPLYVDQTSTPNLIANGPVPAGAIDTFLITFYLSNGTAESKFSLQPVDMPAGSGWMPGDPTGAQKFPIEIGYPDCFILNDLGSGAYSIQTSMASPEQGPYLHGAKASDLLVTYGWVEAGDAGQFQIKVVNS